ncbi:MAG: TonB-dependent receptor [Bacteroidales bacterium]|nr:TonB-dependent receptor [Bacteroidales bacterium]
MKGAIASLSLFLLFCIGAGAQVIIFNDNVFAGRMSTVTGTVVDSLTNEPISFASFYVVPAKDTTISNFTITDAEGKAKLEDVPYGNYIFRVEMLGFKPYVKEKYFRDREVDMGTIKLQVDEHYLEAAVVTDVGNPIVVKKDTVEFNASSFQVGTNAMLKDLLKRMPGMEITDEGKVTFNGEAIDKLTVGGRTFFFDDQSTALNNLPASIVDKVRVIDRESEKTRDTGLQDGSREKVLDVGLKKEYEKGWFGNAGIKGGTTFAGDKEDPLRDNRGILYSGNALVSAYSEKDQVTVIANGMNINDSEGVVFVAITDSGERLSNVGGGLSSAAQFGVNANTSRIKDVATTVSANYKYGDTRTGSTSARTTFQEDGDIFSTSENSGRQFRNSVSTNAELTKEGGNLRFHFRPSFNYNENISRDMASSGTSRLGTIVNESESRNMSRSTNRSGSGSGDFSFRDLGGKKNRVLSLYYSASISDSDGNSLEDSYMRMISGVDNRSLKYIFDNKSYGYSGGFGYGEPLGEKWTLSGNARFNQSRSNSIRDAFDVNGKNDYYSSESRNNSISQKYGMTAQYKFDTGSWVTFGMSLNGMLNETYSKSFNVSSTTGMDEWNWFVAPDVRFQITKGSDRFYFNLSGTNQQPGRDRMLPTMNIMDPSRPSIGNIYLRPYNNSNFSSIWNRNNRERFSTLMLYFLGNYTSNPITYARWYDSDGVFYSIPVNSRKSYISTTFSSTYTTPLDSKKKWFLTAGFSFNQSRSTSYQARGTLAGLDKDSFDYSSFMKTFWGDNNGDIFYSGKSGFQESVTRRLYPSASLSATYRVSGFSGRVFSSISGNIVKYSLDSKADMNTRASSIGVSGNYSTKHEFEFDTDISYAWYDGYAPGYGQPELKWNGEISKNVKAFTFSVKVHDILDQTRNLNHTVTANYEEDTYTLVMGRYILFGLKWNFGKMNAAHSQRAQNAALNMVF